MRPAIVNSGQPGFEQAALVAAAGLGLEVGGYLPAGAAPVWPGQRQARSAYPDQALKWCVRESDASLLLLAASGPTRRQQRLLDWCRRYRKPWVCVQGEIDGESLRRWLRCIAVRRLHLSGPLAWQMAAPEPLAEALLQALLAASSSAS